jgi:hypothetical protein
MGRVNVQGFGPGHPRYTIIDLERRRFHINGAAEIVPGCDGLNLPSGEKRAAYALEDIAFRVGRMEQTLAKIRAKIAAAALANPDIMR